MKKTLQALAAGLIMALPALSQPATNLSFDGTNDYITCGNILTTSYTKEAWVFTNGGGLNNNFVSGGSTSQHALWGSSGNGYKLAAGHNGSWQQVIDVTPLTFGTWYHVAVTYDAPSTTMKLYKNGVLISTNTGVPVYNGGTGSLQLGSYDGQANLLLGGMDEVRIWNYARTASDISSNMNCELYGPQTGLIAYYKFNQGIASGNNAGLISLLDVSGNNNNGTLHNFALTGATSNWVTGSPVFGLPNVTASVNDSLICMGDSVMFNGSGALTYTWTGGVVNAMNFMPPASGIYTVTGTDVNGCRNSAAQSVTVNTLPAISVSVSDSVLCAGDSTMLTASGAITYTWTGGVINATSFAPTGTGSYTVTGTDVNGCKNSAVNTVTVNALPPVSVIATKTAVCTGDSTTFSGSGATTYTWSGGISNGVSFTPTTTSTYTVTGTDANGCINSAVKSVTVNSLPSIGASTSNSMLCVGQTATITATGASTYTWNTSATTAS
ncbi:MAG: LamG-like jellyroll fold domain-containing protein, partial [Bacteroidia bacterium]